MTIKFVICYESFARGLRVIDTIESPFNIYCDNKLAIFYSNNNRSCMKLKFINIKYLVAKEK
ncbi:hypothetical protein CR513_44034, partial [Mucuna pruriens]